VRIETGLEEMALLYWLRKSGESSVPFRGVRISRIMAKYMLDEYEAAMMWGEPRYGRSFECPFCATDEMREAATKAREAK
jgi:hypothetical protein